MRNLFGVSTVLLVALCASPLQAQEFPAKPLRLIVPNAPGSVLESAARIVSPDLSKALGQPVVVESRPGAGGIIAYEHVIKQSPADGYTLLMSASDLLTLPLFVKDLSFDPLRDLPPVSLVAEGVSVLFSPYGAPWSNYNEFVAYAKANPGKLNFGSAAFGQPRLILELTKQKNNLNTIHVAYKGGTADVTRAILANEIQLGVHGEAVESLAKEKKVKVLAIAGSQRLASFPEVPTFAEVGIPEMPPGFAFAIHTRAGTPKQALEKIHAATVHAVQLPQVREQLAKIKLYAVSSSPEAALKKFSEQSSVFAAVARKAGIQPQ